MDRDGKGRFQKGHTLFSGSNGIKNGRKKTLTGEVKDALREAQDQMPAIIRAMIIVAKDNTHKDSQRAKECLLERVYGKVTQPIDANVAAEVAFLIGKGYADSNEAGHD